MAQEVVRLEDIWVQYNGTPVLANINLSINSNDFLGIIGPNGGGKTTMLKLILGLLPPSRGTITVLGKPPNQSREHIGYVAQFNLFDHDFPVNVLEVALMGRYSKTGLVRRYSQQDKIAAEAALEKVGMLDYKKRQIGELSGGQQQRVFIARALVSQPLLLLLDEPTASIDSTMQTEFYDLLENLKQQMAIVIVSHDIGAVSVYVNKIACLNQQLYYHGSKEITPEILVQLITHGEVPHRVLKEH
jgi:zinc transport system ATP-binding protein